MLKRGLHFPKQKEKIQSLYSPNVLSGSPCGTGQNGDSKWQALSVLWEGRALLRTRGLQGRRECCPCPRVTAGQRLYFLHRPCPVLTGDPLKCCCDCSSQARPGPLSPQRTQHTAVTHNSLLDQPPQIVLVVGVCEHHRGAKHYEKCLAPP